MLAPIINDSVVNGVTKFLDALNSGGGKPIEQLSSKDACQVLTDAQNSVRIDSAGFVYQTIGGVLKNIAPDIPVAEAQALALTPASARWESV
jgi:hypothetical protein